MKSTFLAIAIVTSIFVTSSCRSGEDGAPGPAGANGQPGYYLVDTLGYISGNVSGTLKNSNSVDFNFELPYLLGMSGSSMYTDGTGDRNFRITRYDSIAESFFDISFSVNSQGDFSGNSATIQLIRKTSNSTFITVGTGTEVNQPEEISLNSFYSWGISGMTFTNASYNSSTGMVSFDYSLEISPDQNTTGNKLDITGTIRTQVFTQSFREVPAN